MNRFARRTLIVVVFALTLLTPGAALAATGTVPAADKLGVLSGWTQTTAASTNAWNAARLDRSAWTAYGFDWSTDYCSDSPDRPLGYDFTLPCWHHDFGYRNYKAMGPFPANKDRLDTMFYNDLKRKCATYSGALQPPCVSLAWTYYQAVHMFGSLTAVSTADLDRAAALKAAA
jgi:Prokaryotic phospholipase A2